MTLQEVVNLRVRFVDDLVALMLDISLSYALDILDLLDEPASHITD